MAEFASNGKANAALTTGITGAVGTGLWLLNGGLNGLFGGNCMRNNGCCNEDHLINRYELQKEQHHLYLHFHFQELPYRF